MLFSFVLGFNLIWFVFFSHQQLCISKLWVQVPSFAQRRHLLLSRRQENIKRQSNMYRLVNCHNLLVILTLTYHQIDIGSGYYYVSWISTIKSQLFLCPFNLYKAYSIQVDIKDCHLYVPSLKQGALFSIGYHLQHIWYLPCISWFSFFSLQNTLHNYQIILKMISPTCNKIHKSYSVWHVVAGKGGRPYNEIVSIIQMAINIKKYFAIYCNGFVIL